MERIDFRRILRSPRLPLAGIVFAVAIIALIFVLSAQSPPQTVAEMQPIRMAPLMPDMRNKPDILPHGTT